jgi:hypothetical protein
MPGKRPKTSKPKSSKPKSSKPKSPKPMSYRIDPNVDRVFVEEFRRCPIGRHSPGLRRVLNALRFDPTGRQVVLVCKKPFREWVLGEMPARRSEPIRIEDGPVFHSREEAEWEAFRRRWRLHTGEAINQPFAIEKA